MKTYVATPATRERNWLVVDATGQTLGRLATQIADALRGKRKPEYTPHCDTGDFVIVVNAEKITVTGNKRQEKRYYRHSGYPGGLRSRTLEEMLARRPEEVIRKAVKGMLPRNRLGRAQLTKLKVYAGPDHPHAGPEARTDGDRDPMTEEPPTPQDDETPAAEADAPAGGEAETGSPEGAEPAPEAQAPAGDEAVEAPAADEAPADDTPTAEETGGATAEGTNAPDAPAEAPDVVGPEGAEDAGSGAEAGAQAAGTDQDADAADRRERPKPSAKKQARRQEAAANEPDVVPGAHLEPDLVLESESSQDAQDEYGAYAQTYESDRGGRDAEGATADAAAAQPERKVLDLAADARYPATGKRKTSVARVILKPGNGTYLINGRPLENFFPRAGLQRQARQPLETAGYESRMDVVARIHGGGVSAQAGALRHGIARALVEADPMLRTELKRKGFLTRDARVKERKKAGLKKARKRPQFSKR